jgi:hypothetical protein
LKADVRAGLFGRPLQLKTLVFFPRNTEYFRRNEWAGRLYADSGRAVFDSPVNNATAHYLHNMFYVLGRTRETSAVPVTVQAELYRANDIENYDTAALRSQTECDSEVLFYTSHAVPARVGPRFRFRFESAVVECDAPAAVDSAGEIIARFHDGRTRTYGHAGPQHTNKLWQCVDAVRTGEPVACGITAAMAHALCVAAAQQSRIHAFPTDLVQRRSVDGREMLCVDGLQTALTNCFDSSILPPEHGGIAWARPGARVRAIRPEVTVTPTGAVATSNKKRPDTESKPTERSTR